jgi:hypothetical protein
MIEAMLLKCNVCLKGIDRRWPPANALRSQGLKQILVVIVAGWRPTMTVSSIAEGNVWRDNLDEKSHLHCRAAQTGGADAPLIIA